MKIARSIDYLFIFLILGVSGIPYFYKHHQEQWLIILFTFSFLTLIKNNLLNTLTWKAILLIFIFVSWELIQLVYYGIFNLTTISGSIIRFFSFYFVILIIGSDFLLLYTRLIRLFAVISLFFYSLFFFPDITNIFINFADFYVKPLFPIPSNESWLPTFIVFNPYGFDLVPIHRNSGPFYEPGIFSIYLNVAILFNIALDGKLLFRRNAIFIIALITTFSTAGYITFFFLFTTSFYFLSRKVIVKNVLIVPVILLFVVVYQGAEFLAPKVQQQYLIADVKTTRFGSALRDIEKIQDAPILGYGRRIEALYGATEWDHQLMHRNNGLTNLFTRWGLILGFFFLWNYYKAFRNIATSYNLNRNFIWIALVSIMLSAFSQTIFRFSFFMGLMLLQYVYTNIKKVNE
jgi:hypothetical protein